jgi:tetratricopeptide (TPR) repeat protein
LKFKRCCADRLRSDHNYDLRFQAFLEEGKFKEALYESRAYVTQYTIWHKSHTESVIRRNPIQGDELLEVDIRALAGHVDNLMFCYIKADMMDEFPAVLERLRGNINHSDWQRKITYLHALHALWPDWDREAGRRELKKLGSVADEKDEEILQLYLDLFDDDLSFSEKQDLIERILTYSGSFGERLHYRAAKAVLFLTIGDARKADTELSEAIMEARERRKKTALSEYERDRLAHMLDLLGALRGDDALLTEALELCRELLKEDNWTASGRANLLGLMGDIYRRKQEWETACQTYIQALALDPSPIYKVFLSGCLLQLEQRDEATKKFGEVKPEDLSASEKIDYAFTLAILAIQTGEREHLENAKAMLQAVQIRDPLFRERRDALLLMVQEAFTSGTSTRLKRQSSGLFARFYRSVSPYLVLKPTFMGMGVDLGKIFEKMFERK